MNIQWYPGHMKKALREINENIKLIDIVVEILDSRIPLSSRNPDIESLSRDKARVIVLNKADLSNEKISGEWVEYFNEKGYFCVLIDSRNRGSFKEVSRIIDKAGEKKRERDRKKGILKRPVRALVCGIPNCGKSTFINTFVGKKSAKTGDKPGVTKGKQWIRLSKDVEMLDTPGILWPKFEDEKTGLNLAICGSIKDEVLKREELCLKLIEILSVTAPGALEEAYKVHSKTPIEMLTDITKKKNYLISGGELDTARSADAILDDFRSGKLGRISLEKVGDENE